MLLVRDNLYVLYVAALTSSRLLALGILETAPLLSLLHLLQCCSSKIDSMKVKNLLYIYI